MSLQHSQLSSADRRPPPGSTALPSSSSPSTGDRRSPRSPADHTQKQPPQRSSSLARPLEILERVEQVIAPAGWEGKFTRVAIEALQDREAVCKTPLHA